MCAPGPAVSSLSCVTFLAPDAKAAGLSLTSWQMAGAGRVCAGGAGDHDSVAGVFLLQPELGRCPWVLGPLSGACAYTRVSIRGPWNTRTRRRQGGESKGCGQSRPDVG